MNGGSADEHECDCQTLPSGVAARLNSGVGLMLYVTILGAAGTGRQSFLDDRRGTVSDNLVIVVTVENVVITKLGGVLHRAWPIMECAVGHCVAIPVYRRVGMVAKELIQVNPKLQPGRSPWPISPHFEIKTRCRLEKSTNNVIDDSASEGVAGATVLWLSQSTGVVGIGVQTDRVVRHNVV